MTRKWEENDQLIHSSPSCSVPGGGFGDSAERVGGKHQLWPPCAWNQLPQVKIFFKVGFSSQPDFYFEYDTLSSSRYAYNISLKEVTQILTRVVLEYPFQQQGPELTASQYVALLLPVSVFFKKKYPYSWLTRLEWILTFGFTVFLSVTEEMGTSV